MQFTEDMWKLPRGRYTSCNKKIRFKTLVDAQESLTTYKHRVLLTDMEIYHCPRHNSYHLGHARRYPEGFFEDLSQKIKKGTERQIEILKRRREKRK